MNEQQILERIVGPDVSLYDIASAFSGPFWSAQAVLRGEVVFITGEVFCGETVIGDFERALSYEKRARRAKHAILELASHRGCGIARAMYARCFRFYDRVGVRFVHLDAEAMGVFVWPSFGFDLVKKKQKQQLASILRERNISPVPSLETLFTTEVYNISTPQNPRLGAEAFEELGRRAAASGQAVPMVLDLNNADQRAILEDNDILESRGLSI